MHPILADRRRLLAYVAAWELLGGLLSVVPVGFLAWYPCRVLLGLDRARYGAAVTPMARKASERPVASPVARWQAQHGNSVSNLFHVAVKVEDEIGRSLRQLATP